MNLKDIFSAIIIEQQDDDDIEFNLPDDQEAGDEDQTTDHEIEPETPEVTPVQQPKKEKPLSEIEKLKQKWLNENPGLTEDTMNNAIDFFNRRKNNMIEYKRPGTINPLTGRRHTNQPEVAALVFRFPEMTNILTDHSRVRDIQNYSWEQMEYYIDRVNTQRANIELEVKIEGDTPELQKAGAYKVWENSNHKVINENGLIVIKVQSKPESITLGFLQHILNNEETEREKQRKGQSHVHINNNWCITHGQNEGNNMYYDYRNRRAYYFVMDKNRDESDVYFLSVLQPINPRSTYHRGEAPYTITLRNNKGERHGLEWREVVDVWPQLSGKEDLIKYFDLTYKETSDISIDILNFTENTAERPNPYDFAIQDISVQRAYIDSDRYINNVRAFDVLPVAEKKLYIAKTKLEGNDYKKRFRCDNPSDPLGILNLIHDSPGGLYGFLDRAILQAKLGLTRGVFGLKKGIIGIEFETLYSTLDEKYTLYRDRTTKNIGLMDIETLDMIKPMGYTHTKTQMVYDTQVSRPYLMFRYVEKHPGEDYFYFLIPMENLTGDKKSKNYMRGLYYNKDAGNNLFDSGRVRVIKGY